MRLFSFVRGFKTKLLSLLLFCFAGLDTPGRCDFEADLCHWQNMTDDKFDWQRHSGNTPSIATGPMYDHTVGFGGLGTFRFILRFLTNTCHRVHTNSEIFETLFTWHRVDMALNYR